MIINLKQLFNITGECKNIDYNITLDELSGVNGFSFASPVHIKGKIFNKAGIVTLEFSADFTLHTTCDRCLKEFDRNFCCDFCHTVVSSLDNDENDDYIIAEKESIDLNDIALTDLILEMPSKSLCKDDCKGLCMVCGCDLNESECNCLK